MHQFPHPSSRVVGVVGAGTMGRGIAQVLLGHGYSVLLTDISAEVLAAAIHAINAGLARDVEKGRLAAPAKEKALQSFKTQADFSQFASADFIIEAAPENFDLKAGIFRQLDRLVPPGVIFASNSSSISITRLAAAVSRRDCFCGLHFFNPVPVMKLVEIIAGMDTSPETLSAASSFATSLGKTAVEVNDFPGFVSNRVLMPMINEAVYTVMEGVAEPVSVDTVMKMGMNHPMGPLELADLIGLDVCLDIMKVLYEGFHDPKYRPCPLLEKMVSAGRLGRKSGRGFYDYP
ncbi:MAG: 3-hydroxyacyl-CoA dehydrogenase family protein [Terriglobia bacterium]